MLNIDRVIEFLEAEKSLKFDMSCWLLGPLSFWDADEPDFHHVPVCGTAACIGGTCHLLFKLNEDGETYNDYESGSGEFDATEWIFEGLDLKAPAEELGRDLFVPNIPGVARWNAYPGNPEHITREHAIAVLRHLRDTGEVEWDLSAHTALTPQEIFDRVIDHLLTQGKPARQKNACLYLTDDGLKCAVGCLLTEEQAREWDSRENGSSLGFIMQADDLKHPPAQWMRDSEILLRQLQQLHDDPYCWSSDFGGLNLGGKVRARQIALQHDLTLPEALQ